MDQTSCLLREEPILSKLLLQPFVLEVDRKIREV